MRPKSLNPITLAGLRAVMKRFGYDCVYDVFPTLQFEKDGTPPKGYEEVAVYWPPVVTVRHPDFSSERHDDPVYDSSEVLDYVVKILASVAPSTDRTNVSAQIRAILKPKPEDETGND